MQIVLLLGYHLARGSFWSRYLRITAENSYIQNDGPKYKKLHDWDKIWYSGAVGVIDYESELKLNISKFSLADRIWSKVFHLNFEIFTFNL